MEADEQGEQILKTEEDLNPSSNKVGKAISSMNLNSPPRNKQGISTKNLTMVSSVENIEQ